MSVKITGMSQVQNRLEREYGRARMQQISDEALKAGAEVFVKELERQFETFKDTGASIEEIDLSEPYWEEGKRTITVRWKGPENRYRIIHLNEFGTVNNPNPKGKGAIARALQSSAEAYKNAIKEVVRRNV